MGKGVYELKIQFGPGYRVYYGLEGSKIVVLLCAGDKSSQKKDIKKAVICILFKFRGKTEKFEL